MLHIYYGMGKGKSSTLNGSAVRATGAGMKVVLFRFLKGRKTSEDDPLKKIGISVYKTQTSEKFVIQMSEKEKKKTKIELDEYIQKLRDIYQEFDLVILDEFLDLIVENVSLMTEEEIISILQEIKNDGKEIMISGHVKNDNIFQLADLITYYNPERHYFEQGQQARKGIEF